MDINIREITSGS